VRFQARAGLDATSFDGNAGVVVVDTKVTPELEREGLARDLIRLIQVARKDAGFNVADRIVIEVKAGPAATAALDAHMADVKGETLAVSLTKTATPLGTVSETKLGDEPITLGVRVRGRGRRRCDVGVGWATGTVAHVLFAGVAFFAPSPTRRLSRRERALSLNERSEFRRKG